ncbi:RecX family transcriptional regulator [Paenibacillus sp. GSMTC-2017]|uniref:RecX family transcriptional regulator n=1 Tax=Paenibacillus sp. GSMTC-2017 TaxID=2794350 RepID=UPI0018D94131|nr:RecX family transcriptional regulator [Paenibacillus sp. GSMTC-2017]MBH5316565.1 RecX family transcriptional regulator [Paenibacillus sp. GSMTC-2017]
MEYAKENTEDGWVIQSVRRDKEEKRRYLIFTEAEEPVLSVHEDIMVRFRLMKGQLITKSLIEEIRFEDGRYRAYAMAIFYLGTKPRTRKQIGDYLHRKELDEQSIEYALDRLESEHLVDDEQYARQFATSRVRSGMKGRLLIKQELQQRGVPKEAAADAVSELDRESELAAAIALAAKKSRSLKGETVKRRQKLTGFLLRRGFPSDIVREAIKSVEWDTSEDDNEEDDCVLLDN